ncbi:hypothetical protein [Desulfitibacter alkalitolerans]|nr:hypothetical protein [Desulfitibacter alkalitolerans]
MDLSNLVKKDDIREILREELLSVINDEGIARKEDISNLKKSLNSK